MNGKPVTIRLIDPPLHEFTPKDDAGVEKLSKVTGLSPEAIKHRCEQLHESNPMLGHRGCRLCITYPEILDMQVTAIIKAAINVSQKGIKVFPEIMIPLTIDKKELKIQVDQARALADGLGLGIHNLRVDVLNGGYIVDVDVEIDSALSLTTSHQIVTEFEARARAEIPRLLEIVTHLEPTAPGDHPRPIEGAEGEVLRAQIIQLADEVCGPGTAHHLILRRSHLPDRVDLSMHLEVPGDTSLPEAHLIAEKVEQLLRAALPQLEHVTIHVEPPEERER